MIFFRLTILASCISAIAAAWQAPMSDLSHIPPEDLIEGKYIVSLITYDLDAHWTRIGRNLSSNIIFDLPNHGYSASLDPVELSMVRSDPNVENVEQGIRLRLYD